MVTQARHAEDLGVYASKAEKIAGETRGLLARIEELLAANQEAGNTTPEVDAASERLREQMNVVDELVADPNPEPEPDPNA